MHKTQIPPDVDDIAGWLAEHQPNPQEKVALRGFYRVQVEEDGKIVGDSGWGENQVVNLGFNQYLVSTLGAIAGSKQISYAAVGTGGAPAASGTALSGESEDSATARAAVTAATSSSSKTLRLTATFSSANSFLTQTRNISNIGLFNTSAVTTGTLFSGAAFTSSAVATNQNINATWIKSSVESLVTAVKKLRKFGGYLLAETIPSQQRAFACGRV